MTEEEIRIVLGKMEASTTYQTEISYSANVALYPDNVMSFTDKHTAYIKAHPALKPEHYLANLKLKTRKRS